jgi:hypothetical protein
MKELPTGSKNVQFTAEMTSCYAIQHKMLGVQGLLTPLHNINAEEEKMATLFLRVVLVK